MNKKILTLAALSIVPIATIVSCANTKQSVKKLADVQNQKLLWQHAGDLPAQKGYEKNVGVAGLLQGTIGNLIVVGGGTNFPEALENGGKKVTHKDLYLLKDVNNKLEVQDQLQLDHEIGYGASVNVPEQNAIYYLGGSPNQEHWRDVKKVTIVNNKLKVEVVGQLPLAFESGVANYKDGKIYFGVGKFENAEKKLANSNKFFVYDLQMNKTEELSAFPGEARQQTVGQILDNKFYVFSGGSNVSYTDGYAYDLDKKVWNKVGDVDVEGQKLLLLGANSIKISDTKMMIIGGFNYDLWNDANKQLSTLKDQALADYKKIYFGAEVSWYGWNKKILIYDSLTDKWSSIGEIPFDAPCGHALVALNENVYSINGEIKPGVRTNRMYKASVELK
ncbi:cyclically-permuted mutarotase family protein [Mycoplasmopsis alligatoris]|uniref:Cyclically-permuted mutatrotase family protein n=1 Tax=Mycoplasmopsis alligatoris A21JP2 TaxID=747682 RepID=D4XWL2_9BACT|nr:cyclically-permuted mutarotase family protein [Mycoplasmopsis alligatoris]EFF41189.1 cyclically-permuted mutatrotase family protein [Mycoplasmopsis alligatoris A21JP2]